MIENSQDTWEKEYRLKINHFEKLEQLLYNLMKTLLKTEGITAQVSSRTKSESSFREKIERKIREGKSYDNPLNEITDIIGIRII